MSVLSAGVITFQPSTYTSYLVSWRRGGVLSGVEVNDLQLGIPFHMIPQVSGILTENRRYLPMSRKLGPCDCHRYRWILGPFYLSLFLMSEVPVSRSQKVRWRWSVIYNYTSVQRSCVTSTFPVVKSSTVSYSSFHRNHLGESSESYLLKLTIYWKR